MPDTLPAPAADGLPPVDDALPDAPAASGDDFERWLLSIGFDAPEELSEAQRLNLEELHELATGAEPQRDPTFVEWCTMLGFDADKLTSIQRANLEQLFELETNPDDTAVAVVTAPTEVVAARLQRERHRLNAVLELCRGEDIPEIVVAHPNGTQEETDLLSWAIRAGWNAAEVEECLNWADER